MNSGHDDQLVRYRRVFIRRKRPADAAHDYAWRTDPDITRYDGVEPLHIPFETYRRQYEADLLVVDPRRGLFAIEDETHAHIGNIMFYNASIDSMSAEIGVSIGDSTARGRGLGCEAVVGFVYYLWSTTPYRTLYLHTLDWNDRAIRTFESAGFSPVAQVRRGSNSLIRMEARREWWLLAFEEGRIPSTSVPAGESRR